MSEGPVCAFTGSMASGVSITGEIDLQKSWNKLSLVVPSMASGSDVYLLASEESGGTYRRVFHQPTNTSATVSAFFVTSGVTNCVVPLSNVNVRYLKVQVSTATTDTPYTFKVICAD